MEALFADACAEEMDAPRERGDRVEAPRPEGAVVAAIVGVDVAVLENYRPAPIASCDGEHVFKNAVAAAVGAQLPPVGLRCRVVHPSVGIRIRPHSDLPAMVQRTRMSPSCSSAWF